MKRSSGETVVDHEEKVAILVLAGEPANLLALETALAPLGCDLIEARTATEALKQLLQEDFAVILLDVDLPGLDGAVMAGLIRDQEQLRNIPIILLSAGDGGPSRVFLLCL